MGRRAFLWVTKATAGQRIEVVAFHAVFMHAEALAVRREPLVSRRAIKGRADAAAQLLVPHMVLLFTRLHDAFELAGRHVPSVVLIGWSLWLADAFAGLAVPDLGQAFWVILFTFFKQVALAGTGFKIPEVVILALLFDADALPGEGVELLVLVVALTHLVAARAVKVAVVLVAPHELAVRAGNQRVGNTTHAGLKLPENNCNSVLYFR